MEDRPSGRDGSAGGSDAENAADPENASPFAVISASMGWDTFNLVRNRFPLDDLLLWGNRHLQMVHRKT